MLLDYSSKVQRWCAALGAEKPERATDRHVRARCQLDSHMIGMGPATLSYVKLCVRGTGL